MQAIETQYKGYRFRSRLEARHAVLFDALGLAWEYEKEGFKFENGSCYLPDFWLPELDCWIEVKGEYPTDDELKLAGFLAENTGKRVFTSFSIEPPFDVWDDNMILNGWLDSQYFFCECPFCHAIGIEYNGRSDRLPCKKNGCPKSEHGDKGYTFDTPRILKAYKAAKSARFEHGEKPWTSMLSTT